MKKLLLLLLLPFAIKAQTPPETTESPVGRKETTGDLTPRQLIESYRARVIKGESMSDMAKRYSQDPGSAKQGGLYTNVGKGVMVPEFEAAAFKLKAGEISEVFETQYGFHFIQLVSHHGETVDLRHILISNK